MKKLTAIFLIAIYFFSASEFYELLKLDDLIQHFYETKSSCSSTSFYHFIVMHYVTDDLNDKDNCKDEALPFRALNTRVSFSAFTYTDGIVKVVCPLFIPISEEKLYLNNIFPPEKHISVIWHPPKLV